MLSAALLMENLEEMPPMDVSSSIHKIKNILRSQSASQMNPTISFGDAGVALFFYTYSFLNNDKDSYDFAEMLVNQSKEQFLESCSSLGLFDGATGLAWIIKHKSIVFNEEYDLSEFDDLLSAHILSGEELNFELVNGLAGHGMYAFRDRENINFELLNLIYYVLNDTKIETENGLHWQLPNHLVPAWQHTPNSEGIINLGAAHGLPGLLSFLRNSSISIPDAELRGKYCMLHDGLFRWLSGKLKFNDSPEYPIFFDSKHLPFYSPMPLRWCYGPLGAGISYIKSAIMLGLDEVRFNLVDSVKVEIEKNPCEVTSYCLCHGYAGNSLIYNSLFEVTGDPYFRNGQNKCLHAINQKILSDERLADESNSSFLEGISGIGLALLQAQFQDERCSNWLELFAL